METTPVTQTTVASTKVAQDAVDTATLAKNVISAYKTGGFNSVSPLVASIISQVEKDYEDVSLAIPEIKTGYKTTEFWLAVGVILLNGMYLLATNKVLPIDANAVLGGVVAVYTAVRGLIKK